MAERVPIGLPEIIASLRERFWFLNLHYEAAWTDSWSHRRCLHAHGTLMDAEDKVVNEFRFGQHFEAGGKKTEGRV